MRSSPKEPVKVELEFMILPGVKIPGSDTSVPTRRGAAHTRGPPGRGVDHGPFRLPRGQNYLVMRPFAGAWCFAA